MIPLKLQLKNFLSYGSELQEVDFEPYNLICLSGKNGHGKSALLDAITWAVWGQARKVSATAKLDEGLLRLGQRQMIVIFDFLFNGKKYRVRREFTSAYGKSYAYLDFAMLNVSENVDDKNAIELKGKTIKETQKKIEEILGLDFDSFINSAFLKQGQSDEFSKKSPKERKEILANILGLNRFENLKRAAQEKAKELNNEKDGIGKVSEHIENELKCLPEINLQITEIEQKHEDFLEQEKASEKLLSDLIKEQNILTEKIQHSEILKVKFEQLNNNFSELKSKFLDVVEKWRNVHKKSLNLKDSKNIEKQKNQIQKQIEELQEKFHKLYSLKEKQSLTKENLSKKVEEFDKKYSKLISEEKFKLDKLVFQGKSLLENQQKLEQEINEIKLKIEKLEIENKTLSNNLGVYSVSLESQFEKKKEFYHTLVANGNSIKSSLKDVSNRCEMISDKQNPSCPLCMQNLSISRKDYLYKQFLQDEALLIHKLNRIKTVLPKLKDYLLDKHNQVKKMRELSESIKLNDSKIVDSTAELSLKDQALKALIQGSIELAEQEKVMHKKLQELEKEAEQVVFSDKNCVEFKKELEKINLELNKINYSESEHKKLKDEFKMLEDQASEFKNLIEQKFMQKERSKNIAELSLALKREKIELKKLQQEQAQFKNLKSEEEKLSKSEHEIKSNLKKLISEKENLLHESGKLKAQKDKLISLEKELKAYNKKVQELNLEIQDYKDISAALSKDGIQALLIEEAIPEIEQETNNLLSRLTNNQSQIFIESLRDLKKGVTKETLDIKISDNVGLRPYEMFSGGEAFRIDFALRIAISKLLARRAGTSLQTLIIDEGFGSQDEEGLVHIMDAIYKIQEDFAKIIIVSHLASLKEQFPIHFVIEKLSTGSRVSVVENG